MKNQELTERLKFKKALCFIMFFIFVITHQLSAQGFELDTIINISNPRNVLMDGNTVFMQKGKDDYATVPKINMCIPSICYFITYCTFLFSIYTSNI